MIEPVNGNILIKVAELQNTSGIYVPESAKEKPRYGTVIRSSAKDITLAAGDTVYYGMYAGVPTTIDDQEYLLVKEAEVLAVTRAGK